MSTSPYSLLVDKLLIVQNLSIVDLFQFVVPKAGYMIFFF